MARYRYDVNTQTKLLDIHKQFQGGLKTVDTDDSLKTLFLRKAENLELSEFGFIEKRYGQAVENELLSSAGLPANTLTSASNLQGYFEYVRSDGTTDKILIIDGKLFLKVGAGSFTQVTNIKSESGKRYPKPEVFVDLGMDVDNDYISIGSENIPSYIFTTEGQLETYTPSDLNINTVGIEGWVVANNKRYFANAVSDEWEVSTLTPDVTFNMQLLKAHTSDHKYYYKKSNNYYIYQKQVDAQGNPYPFYQLLQVSSTDFTDADFQKTRKIEAARVDDVLYIFTGTYPITYRGDGNFYLLDIYKPNDVQIELFSHNYLENDYEDVYRYNTTLSAVNNSAKATNTGPTISHEDTSELNRTFDYGPELPYNTGLGKGFRAEITYQYRTDKELQQGDFNSFLDTNEFDDDESTPTHPSSSHNGELVAVGHIPNTGSVFVELFPRIYTREAGVIDESAWQPLDDDFLEYNVRTNADISSVFNVGTYYQDGFVQEQNYADLSSNSDFHTIQTTSPFQINISKLPLGTIDLRIELVSRESGYTDLGPFGSSNAFYRFEQKETVIFQNDYLNLLVNQEKIQDYNDYPKHNTYPDVWSATKVLPHYGKLIVYGSLGSPQYAYINHPQHLNYFPAFFSEEFTTEERDPIVKIAPFQNILVIMSEDYIWGIKGVDADTSSINPYRRFTISPLYGTIAPESVRPVRNYLMFLSKEGIMQLVSLYAVDEQYNVKPADENIRNIVPRIEDDKYDPRKAVAIQFEDQYWIHFPDKQGENENNMVLRYYADTKSWMKDTYFTKQSTNDIVFKGIHKWIRRTGKGLAYISLPYYDGSNYRIDEILLNYSIPSDLGYPVQSIMETAYLEQGYPFHPKQYKELKLEFTLQNEYNASTLPLFTGTAANFELEVSFRLNKNHKYRFDVGKEVGAFVATIDGVDYQTTENAVTPTEGGQTSYYYEFTYTGSTGDFDIAIPTGETENDILNTDTVTLSDITYDDEINYYLWVIADEKTLNLDNLTSYSASQAKQTENLGTKSGTWKFGETDFGNRIAAVQTTRLSGKGKNIKVYLEEISKSKWTLESLGFMYKLRRARGNR